MTRAQPIIGFTNAVQRGSQSGYMVMLPDGVIYTFFTSAVDSSLYWTKSSDGGFSWTDPALVKALGGASSGFSLWYDKWTEGNTGTIVHLAYFEQSGDDVFYRSLDTASDTLGTEATIFAGGTTGAVASTCISITIAIGGNLYCAFDIDGGTEVGFYRSIDAGANWTARTDVNEGSNTDYYLLAPGYALDDDDIICIYWDRSADEISRKLYDNSGDAWAEDSIAASMADLATSTAGPQFSICMDHANNKVLLAAWSATDAANADLRFWAIDDASITEGTPIVSNGTDDQGTVALGLATDTSTLYAFYCGKSDGSETFTTAVNIYYKASTDFGATWGAETQLSLGVRGFDYLMTFPRFVGDFGVLTESQTAALDTLMYSALLPEGGGASTNLNTSWFI